MKRLPLVLFLTALLVGCASAPKQTSTPGPSASGLAGTEWTLVQIDGEEVAATPTLAFSDSTVSGTGGCNRFSGPYVAESGGVVGPGFSAGPLVATKMFCADQQALEIRYFEALDGARRWLVDGDVLELAGAETALLFRRSE